MQKLHYVIIFDTNSPLRPLLSKKKKKKKMTQLKMKMNKRNVVSIKFFFSPVSN